MALYHDSEIGAIVDFAAYAHANNYTVSLKQDYEDTVRSSTESVTTRAHAHAREGIDELGEMAIPYAYYCECFDRPRVAPSVRRDMMDCVDAGIQPEVICAALDAAMDAPSPSWAYARAVLRACIAEKCFTLAQYEARQAAHRARRDVQRSPFAHNGDGQRPPFLERKQAAQYAQRTVTDAEFDTGFYVDVMKGRENGQK